MSVLEVHHLSKNFGGVAAVDDVSFSLGQSEFLALIGPNGAGKTTCFNMLNGYLKPDRGSVRLGEAELVGLKPRTVWRMGVG
ncbi:MAG: ATP-binding cassette domain-containing protein, partial [Pseudomonadota bacterium]